MRAKIVAFSKKSGVGVCVDRSGFISSLVNTIGADVKPKATVIVQTIKSKSILK